MDGWADGRVDGWMGEWVGSSISPPRRQVTTPPRQQVTTPPRRCPRRPRRRCQAVSAVGGLGRASHSGWRQRPDAPRRERKIGPGIKGTLLPSLYVSVSLSCPWPERPGSDCPEAGRCPCMNSFTALMVSTDFQFMEILIDCSVSIAAAYLRSEMSDRHGLASWTEDTICPTTQRCVCVMRPDSECSTESRCQPCRGAAETCGETHYRAPSGSALRRGRTVDGSVQVQMSAI